jgi:hypothetical protein
MKYVILEPTTIRRGDLSGAAPEMGWRATAAYGGPFASWIAAARAYVVAFEPHLVTASDDFVRRYIRPAMVNLRAVRIVRARTVV